MNKIDLHNYYQATYCKWNLKKEISKEQLNKHITKKVYLAKKHQSILKCAKNSIKECKEILKQRPNDFSALARIKWFKSKKRFTLEKKDARLLAKWLKNVFKTKKVKLLKKSNSFSLYFLLNDNAIIRISDHWCGVNDCEFINSCEWELNKEPKKELQIAYASFDEFTQLEYSKKDEIRSKNIF